MEEQPIPAQLRYYAQLRYGDAGRSWLAELDGLIDGLATNFELEVAAPFDPGGSEAWTALARRSDGSEAVLKVPISAHAARIEADALLRWGGRGAVRLFELAPEGNALLLECCRPGRRLSEENFETQDEVTAELFGRVHVQLSEEDRRFPDLAQLLEHWAERSRQRYRELNTPCGADLLEDATRIMENVHPGELLLHGDLHPENTLSAEREPWLAIDPIPMVGTPAFDAVQYLLFRGGSLEDRVTEWPEHIRRFCRVVGVDRDELCRLAFAKLVHDGLWALELGETNWAEHLEVAELLRGLSLRLRRGSPLKNSEGTATRGYDDSPWMSANLPKVPRNLIDAARSQGDLGRWLETLPTTVRTLERRWNLEIAAPFQPGGSCSWVAPARNRHGHQLALKVIWRHPEALHEADGLRVWDGDGVVKLYAAEELDEQTSALLLERCVPGTTLAQEPELDQDVVVAGLLRRLWRHDPSQGAFRSLQAMCDEWADEYEEKVAAGRGRLDPDLGQLGIELFRALPDSARESVLLCTDLHASNILAAEREPWLVIDPKPYVGDPHYDALQHMLNCPHRLVEDPHRLVRRMADLLDLEHDRLLAWLFARCVQDSPDWPVLAEVAVRIGPVVMPSA